MLPDLYTDEIDLFSRWRVPASRKSDHGFIAWFNTLTFSLKNSNIIRQATSQANRRILNI
jgi:hypothetical protein